MAVVPLEAGIDDEELTPKMRRRRQTDVPRLEPQLHAGPTLARLTVEADHEREPVHRKRR